MRLAKGKKGLQVFAAWVEISVFLFIILGSVLGFFIKDQLTNYAVFMLCGMITGTMIFTHRQSKLPYLLLATGFAIGFLLASRQSKIALLILFIAANYAAYFMFMKNLIKL